MLLDAVLQLGVLLPVQAQFRCGAKSSYQGNSSHTGALWLRSDSYIAEARRLARQSQESATHISGRRPESAQQATQKASGSSAPHGSTAVGLGGSMLEHGFCRRQPVRREAD